MIHLIQAESISHPIQLGLVKYAFVNSFVRPLVLYVNFISACPIRRRRVSHEGNRQWHDLNDWFVKGTYLIHKNNYEICLG